MEAFDDDDDFGELYADFETLPLPPTTNLCIQQQQQEEQLPDPNGDGGCVAMSDSDDDDGLNIVLNDDDGVCNGLPPVARSDDVDDDGGGEGGGDGGGGERLEDRSEFLSKNGIRGGYGSMFFRRKYTMNRGLNKCWWNGDTYAQNLASSSSHVTRMCATPNPMGFQYGYGSVLPWYWSIFDVNIDTFPEKSWRVPGADITDYFNFGFNENTWKLYCASLLAVLKLPSFGTTLCVEQLWQTSMGTGISGDESLKQTQEATSQQQVVSGSALSPSSEFELPKGRAIQVEDNMIERKPSMDVKRPRNQDSDVIIQIKVHDSSDDCSGSGNSIVMDGSLEGEPVLVDNGNILTSSGELDVSEDQLEVAEKSVQQRSGLIPGVDEHELQDEVDKHSNDAAQVLGGETKSEQGIAIDKYGVDPCWIESELSLGDQELSLTSYTDSDSEATEKSVHVDNEKSHSPLRRQSVNSDISLKNASPVHHKNSKGNSLDRRPPNVAHYSRNKGPFQKERRLPNGRHRPGSSIEYVNNSSSFPSSSARDLSMFRHQFTDYDICKERVPGFASRKRRYASYGRETKQSYHGREKVNSDLFKSLHTKYSYRDDREISWEKTNRYDRKYGNERDYFFEPRSPMEDDEGRERNWHDADLEYYDDDLSPPSCWGLRQFPRKHSSFRDGERGAHRRRINDRFGDRYCNDDFDEYEFEFLKTSYRMSPYSERELESLNNRHEESFLDTQIDWRRSVRRDRHRDRPLDLDNLWPGEREDYSQKYPHYQISKNIRQSRQSHADSVRNYAYGTRVTEKFEVSRTYEHARNNRGSYGYTDAVEDEDFMIDPAEEYQCYRSPSQVLNWTEDKNVFRRHEDRAISLQAKVQLGDIELQQHQLNMLRSSGNCLNGRSKIMGRGKCWQAVPRYRKSVHFVNDEQKSHPSSRVLHNSKVESVDQGMAKKRRALVGFDEFHDKSIKLRTSKCESNHRNKKSLQNIMDKGHKDCLDIEEGGYDSQRILDTLAKMEKRRERFKQSISTKAEASSVINNDSAVDTGEMKQHRPARKRSWVGS
ncbi:hypothetical protein PIB30_017599 [Stylosanthes scabra]|uniref:Pre-mRNA polyadenylation factor Fip1 domain-containing protein n=1 Tax=Stylosanthes scabra TaxID=79078 RepID=A0ABU6U701_9FABA|nr:hypothetical protein [Stylosanthes scabra]